MHFHDLRTELPVPAKWSSGLGGSGGITCQRGHKAQGLERPLDKRRESLCSSFSEACAYSKGTISKMKANASKGSVRADSHPTREGYDLPTIAVKATRSMNGYRFRRGGGRSCYSEVPRRGYKIPNMVPQM